ncbi:MAG TPA: Spy/CpxP family protein refolding chaperone [Rhizomicrobium sp.]|nr:Spy/CpxP family protein refolding chaperone [Rhizomicrobium sp.]
MRKALFPMIASLALCGTATAALIVTKAHADQATHRPVMVAALTTPDDAPSVSRPTPPPDMLRGAPQMRTEHRAQLCKTMYAHKVGEMAFLETKLSLTSAQTPLFARWKEAALDIAKRHESECAAPMHRAERASIVDRMAMEEKLLKLRLADIDAERPALAALYGALTPAQKEEFGEGDMHRMAGRMHMMMGMMGRPHAPEMGGPEMGPDHGPDGPPPVR